MAGHGIDDRRKAHMRRQLGKVVLSRGGQRSGDTRFACCAGGLDALSTPKIDIRRIDAIAICDRARTGTCEFPICGSRLRIRSRNAGTRAHLEHLDRTLLGGIYGEGKPDAHRLFRRGIRDLHRCANGNATRGAAHPCHLGAQSPARSLVAHRRGKSGHLRGICTQTIDDRGQVAHLSLDDAPIDAPRSLQALKIGI